MSDEFDRQRARSKRVEQAVAKWLCARGWLILPTYDFSGDGDQKAPKLQANRAGDALIVPDLLGFQKGRRLWWEIKLKTEASWTHITQRMETGCDVRHFVHYRKVQAESGAPVWLVFVHESQDEVLAATLDELIAAKPRRAKVRGKDLFYFPCSAMKRLGSLSDVLGASALRRAA